jgi:hypothetical protein
MLKSTRFSIYILFILMLVGCNSPAAYSGFQVWLDVPVNGLVLPEIQPVLIEGHVTSMITVDRIEVSINGALWQTIDDPTCVDTLCPFSLTWNPGEIGDYLISVEAFDSGGLASPLDKAMIKIGNDLVDPETPLPPTITPTVTFTPEISPTPTQTVTPTFTPTVTKTSAPKPVVQFWAEPADLVAGKCTVIHWNTANVRSVVFGGLTQPLVGNDDECPCENKSYTLTVTHLDGTIENRTITVTVSGSCVALLPPAPTLVVPSNGLSLTCRASQALTWTPVEVAGGVSQYQVEIQRSSNNITWSAYPGSPLTGLTDITTSIAVECGWYYRWRVRAINSTGGAGPWSGWFSFAIQLS